MKTRNQIAIAVLSAAMTLQACNSPDKKEIKKDGSVGEVGSGMDPKRDTGFVKSTANTPTDAQAGKNLKDYTNESHVESDDAAFLKKAALLGMMEVELGKLAQQSTNRKVKALADKIVGDHTRVNQELKTLARKVEILLPAEYTDEQKQQIMQMKSFKGADFDKHYVDMMVSDHKNTIALFKRATDTMSEPVKKFAAQTLTALKNHWEQALALNNELK